MSVPEFTVKQGATLALELDALQGDVGTVTSILASLRKVKSSSYVLTGAEPEAADFTVTPRAAVGDVPAGWSLKLPPSITATLETGIYVADARLAFGVDDAEITQSWTVKVEAPATRV